MARIHTAIIVGNVGDANEHNVSIYLFTTNQDRQLSVLQWDGISVDHIGFDFRIFSPGTVWARSVVGNPNPGQAVLHYASIGENQTDGARPELPCLVHRHREEVVEDP